MLRKAVPLIVAVALAGAACSSPTAANPVPETGGANPSPIVTVPSSSSPAAITPLPAATSASGGPATASPQPAPSGAQVASGTGMTFDPANFVVQGINPWFPLIPGTTLTYRGTKDEEPASDVFQITAETKMINGVRCLVIRDTLRVRGKLSEQTEDWYATDQFGNVWYFGEDTREYNGKGKVISTEGTWQAGVDGAQPGIFMPVDPQVGQTFQQEFYAGHAEDRFVVLHLTGSVKVGLGSFRNALVTAEWTPLEPDALGQKFYVKDIGLVKEVAVTGEPEDTELVKVKRP